MAPAPEDAPPLPQEWRELGAPSHVWAFRDAAGRVLRYTLRFPQPDAANGEVDRPRAEWTDKTIRAATLRRGDNGRLRWALKAEPDARPLYGLDRLAARPGAPVLLAEGEKDADGAAQRFPGFVCMTWPGGSNAVGKADFAPLHGRSVIVWGDADAPGRKASQAAARAAGAAGAVSVAVVDPPGYFPEGWGLADPWPDGFDQAKASSLVEAARADAQPGDVEWPWGFRMDGDGLWYDQPAQGGGKPIPTRIAAPFEVVGEARDPDGGGWSVVVRFRDRDGREKTVPVSKGRLASGGAEVRAELADAGLVISPARGKSDKFAIALMEVAAARRLTLVAATGWSGARFVLPGEVIGPGGGEGVIFTGEPSALHYRRTGSLAAWREGVAAFAVGNDLLAFALSLAFLGPLMRPLALEGGGVHFRGSSSCGKTTLAYAAGSVWGGGGPLGFGQTWRATANALEMVAWGHNDGLLVLDELALVAHEEAGASAYALASGQSKARARADGSLRRRAEWRVAILSTGEIGLADHIRAGKRGERPMAGQELRLLDIAADAGAQMGVWGELHGLAGPAALSDAVKAASGRDFGHAGPAFVEAFTARQAEAESEAKAIMRAFVQHVEREGDTGQAQRAALRFAAIAAAGELATLFGVTGWPPGIATTASANLYHRWAAVFGRDRSHEARAALLRVKAIIESEGASFAPWEDGDDFESTEPSRAGRDEQARGLKTHGWRVKVGPALEFRFNDAGWAYVTEGLGRVEVAKALHEAGFLERGEGEHWKKRHSRKGQKLRLWTVKGSLLEADLGD
ncbi:DUF927 domain-containing protein [Phenylobacterium sp. SCN 70-31]|uniref:DUF927 domain-containing protein n=1 Tax=Phenylobacterium sp. SCN 70-31 TaxID=1660129 RepID=UPI000A5A6745|nr:DUF927 domain-containing protein [Phenylobacterium sp. SCN 70-31]